MKKISKIIRVALITLCYLGFTLFINSCKDDNTPPNCGCESETRTTIPESANLIGRIAYKTQIDPLDNYYNNTFWIGYTEQNCSNCIHKMIVCNDDILGNEFDDIIESGENVEVKFSGDLKVICEKKFDLADITYERITLTSIERQ